MNVPRTSAEPGQSQPQMGGETGSGRGRTATTACERCRRRKIRCDGETPCATCRRFRINCVRTQKNDTQALEQRVRQLEAQIAEFNTQSQNHGSGPVGLPSPQPWSSDVQFNVDFGSPGPAVAMDQTFSQFHPGSPSPLEIPSIQVVDYADSMSPVSPVSLSPSPMLRPLAPARPNPISDGLGAGLRPPSTGPAVSPPPTAIPSPSPHHGLMPYLSPRSLPGPSRSRSSSISSLGLDTDWASAPDLSVYGLTDSELESGIFDVPPTSPDTETLQAPTRFEAETLIDKFFIQIQITAYPLAHYPLDRFKLLEFLNIIHHQQVPTLDAVHDWPCSESMARFHVYMAMAVSLRMEKDGRDSTLSLLQKCYRLALKETQEPSFWKQAFAQEAAVLFVLFAQVSGQEYP